MKIGNRGTITGSQPITYTDTWEVSADGGLTWTAAATGTGFSDLLLGTHAGKKVRFTVLAVNAAGSATASSAPYDIPSATPAIPSISYVATLNSVATDAAAATVIGQLSAVPTGITRTKTSGNLTLASNGRDVLRGSSTLPVGLNAATITVTDSASAGGPYAGAAAVTRTVNVTVSAAVTPEPITYTMPLDGKSSLLPSFSTRLLRTGVGKAMVLQRDSASGPIRDFTATGDLKPTSTDLAWINGGTTRVIGIADQRYNSTIVSIPWAQAPKLAIDSDGRAYMLADSTNVWFGFGASSVPGHSLARAMITASVNLPTDAGYGHLLTFAADGTDWGNQDNAVTSNNSWVVSEIGGPGDIYVTTKRAYGYTVDAHFDMPRNAPRVMQIGSGGSQYYARVNNASVVMTPWGSDNHGGYDGDGTPAQLFVFGNPGGRRALNCRVYEMYATGDESQSGIVTDWGSNAMISLGLSTPSSGGGSGGAATPTTLTYTPSQWVKPSQPAPVDGVVFAPATLQASSSNEIVGFNFGSPKDQPITGRTGRFAQFFAPGQVMPSDTIDAFWSGAAHPAQMDAKRVYPDGSVKHAVITTQFPALTTNQRVQAMLRKGATASGSPVTMAAASSSNVSATITALGQTFDIGPATMIANYALAGTWLAGNVAREIRCQRYLGQGLRVVLDATVFADGTCSLRYQFCGDVQGWEGGYVSYWPATIQFGQGAGQTSDAFNWTGNIWFGTSFTKSLFTGNSPSVNAMQDPPEHNIEFDVPHLVWSGAVPPYGMDCGVIQSKLNTYEAAIADGVSAGWWRAPFERNFVYTPNMRMEGSDREDIGVLPGWHADYLLTSSPVMRRFVIAQAETFLALPIQYYDVAKNVPLNIYPDIGNPGMQLADNADVKFPNYRGYDMGAIGKDFEFAHQPLLSYTAYLITGERVFWDGLSMQANIGNALTWTLLRAITAGGITKDNSFLTDYQVRSCGWRGRDVGLASHLCPDSDPFRVPFAATVKFNYQYLLEAAAVWRPNQGEAYGWLGGSSWFEGNHRMAPWMMDHVTAGTYCCWLSGCEEAGEWLREYNANYQIGRDQSANGIATSVGASLDFQPIAGDTHLVPADFEPKTWAGWLAVAVNPDHLTENGWPKINGSALWSRSLSLIAMVATDPTPAKTVLNRILAWGDENGTSPARNRYKPIDYLRPLTRVT